MAGKQAEEDSPAHTDTLPTEHNACSSYSLQEKDMEVEQKQQSLWDSTDCDLAANETFFKGEKALEEAT